ncbi:hypothetical protein KY345_06665 [Candidatus Woesearchaeota archaeon]|nr:hypothetical protein [Candidatus Woesearchaeota archaeon]
MRKKEEAHHLVDDEEKRWKTTPLGVRILIVYTSILALFYLIFGLTIPTNIFFGAVMFGLWARILNIVFLGVLVVIVTGFLMKKHWAGGVAFGFFLFEILNLLFSFILKFSMMKHAFIIITSAAVVLLNSLILWYIYEKREYFTDLRHFKSGKADRFFITAIVFLAVMMILSTATYAATMYKSTMETTDRMVEEIQGRSKEEAMFRCSFYEGNEKDVCYVVVATAYKNVPREICDDINDNFYKLTCMQAVII